MPTAMIGIMPIVAPEPEPEPVASLLTEPEPSPQLLAESDKVESSEERNRDPPSKKGLGLGIVFSCYYSHDNCELIETLEPYVVEWIVNSNHIKHTAEKSGEKSRLLHSGGGVLQKGDNSLGY